MMTIGKAAIILLLIKCSLVQQEYHIKKIWLFSKTEYNGNVPVIPGKQKAKGYKKKLLCYLEIEKDRFMPQWQNASFNGSGYSVLEAPLNQDSVTVGTDNKTNKMQVIKPAAGDKIVQLLLTLKPADTVGSTAGFMLKGTFNHKASQLKFAGPVIELSPDMAP